MTRFRKRRKKTTLTKRITALILFVGMIEGTIPYILSFLEKDPVTEVAIAWITSVVAVALGYFIRGYKDSKSSADFQLKYDRWREKEYGDKYERDISD